jgi:hypothetical protein
MDWRQPYTGSITTRTLNEWPLTMFSDVDFPRTPEMVVGNRMSHVNHSQREV